jgi:phosphoenolpyruvate carboxykinase (GTP)
MSSEKTAAAAGVVGELRFDPFAMLPFCGYNMGDYFKHWLHIGATAVARDGNADNLPNLYWVNWFRKGDDGKFLWPGYGENSRVLKWIIERVNGEAPAVVTAIGRVPAADGIDTTGLDLDAATLALLLQVDTDAWRAEVPQLEGHYDFIGERLPAELRDELRELEKRLTAP